MARNRFACEVLTPEGEIFNEEVEMVSMRTTTGSIGLLAGHEPLLARLEPGELRLYRSEGEIVRFAQAEGYVQMSENRALLLVEEAIDPAHLDAAALRERVDAARAASEAAPEGSEEQARAQRDRRRAEVFLEIAAGGGGH
ncbi:MAG TPA: ATP synthase F1 subunit epsilon [Solirubrobacteraceae bacterium]|nr:ATP synthase F1 subunit epsilon [Solirubrobacteraceae bacterium]